MFEKCWASLSHPCYLLTCEGEICGLGSSLVRGVMCTTHLGNNIYNFNPNKWKSQSVSPGAVYLHDFWCSGLNLAPYLFIFLGTSCYKCPYEEESPLTLNSDMRLLGAWADTTESYMEVNTSLPQQLLIDTANSFNLSSSRLQLTLTVQILLKESLQAESRFSVFINRW